VANSTWWNLPDEKRARITEAAMQEFGTRGFSAGSLNVIASQAGIAKGTLFQYFDDKLDFFVTVVEHVASEVGRSVLTSVTPDAGFFDNLRHIVRQWMRYFRDHPVERRIAYASLHEIEPDVRDMVRAVPNAHHKAALEPLISAATARGELRADVDQRMVLSMTAIVLRHLNSGPFDPAGDVGIPMHELSDAAVDRWALAYVDVLEAAFAA
jgi:AcrR family transcriptional regulator